MRASTKLYCLLLISACILFSCTALENSVNVDEISKSINEDINKVTSVSQFDLTIYGSAVDFYSREPINWTQVYVESTGHPTLSLMTDSTGTFEVLLDVDDVYTITFSAEGYVSKFVEIDATRVPEIDKVGGFSMNLALTLFEYKEGVDFSLFDDAFGKSRYNTENKTIMWDVNYDNSIQERLSALVTEYEAH